MSFHFFLCPFVQSSLFLAFFLPLLPKCRCIPRAFSQCSHLFFSTFLPLFLSSVISLLFPADPASSTQSPLFPSFTYPRPLTVVRGVTFSRFCRVGRTREQMAFTQRQSPYCLSWRLFVSILGYRHTCMCPLPFCLVTCFRIKNHTSFLLRFIHPSPPSISIHEFTKIFYWWSPRYGLDPGLGLRECEGLVETQMFQKNLQVLMKMRDAAKKRWMRRPLL